MFHIAGGILLALLALKILGIIVRILASITLKGVLTWVLVFGGVTVFGYCMRSLLVLPDWPRQIVGLIIGVVGVYMMNRIAGAIIARQVAARHRAGSPGSLPRRAPQSDQRRPLRELQLPRGQYTWGPGSRRARAG
jgi:hypothetical protein